MVDSGLRPGRRRRLQEDRRRLREGERQQDRLHDRALCPDAAKDRRRHHQRRRPRPVSEQPDRDERGMGVGRQAGRCQRRRRHAEGGVHRGRAAFGQLLQQRHEETQLLPGPVPDGIAAEPHLAVAGREGRLQDRGHPQDLGRLLRLLPGRADKVTRAGHAQRLRSRVSGDHPRQRSRTTSSTTSCSPMAAETSSARTASSTSTIRRSKRR